MTTAARRSPKDTELARLREELAATQELVRLMAGEADVRSVLEAVMLLTGRLVSTGRAGVYLLEGGLLKLKGGIVLRDGQLWLESQDEVMVRRRAVDAPPGEPWQTAPVASLPPYIARQVSGLPPDPGLVAGRAVLERRTVAVSDVFGHEGDEYPVTRATAADVRAQGLPGYAAIAATPLLRGGQALGVLSVTSTTPHAFTSHELVLLETFAGQAALAIENARLFADLQERLEEQQATGRVLETISRAPTDLQTVLDTITESAARLCDAEHALIVMVQSGAGRVVAGVNHAGRRFSLIEPGPAHALDRRRGIHARAIVDRAVAHVDDLAAIPEDELAALGARQDGSRSLVAVPLTREGTALGSIQLSRNEVRPFTDRQIALLETFAAQAVIAIENARLFQELQASNATLKDALERQTATSEVLRSISRSPTDLDGVLVTIAREAARLCGASDAQIYGLEDGHAVRLAHFGSLPIAGGVGSRVPLDRESITTRTIASGSTVHVPDVLAPETATVYSFTAPVAARLGYRAVLCVPLKREQEVLGTINIRRETPGAFRNEEVALLESFADQAVIAIENARLFQELNDANATLQEALAQQTATAEVLREMGRAALDLRPLLDRLGEHVYRLTGAQNAQIWRFDGERLHLAAMHGGSPSMHAFLQGASFTPREMSRALPGRAALERRVIQVDDMLAEPPGVWMEAEDSFQHDYAVIRAAVGIPLLRGETLAGVLTFWRERPEPFTPTQVRLAQTFADQAAIAIENARLFSELQERDERRARELERANTIQQRLLPAHVEGWPGLLEIAVRFRPAVETSGDFYDVLRLAPAEEGTLRPLQIAVGDVAGKGMSAALVTALARTALRSTAAVPTALATPANTLRLAGQRLHEDVGSSHFVACALAVVEPPGLHNRGPLLRLSNAAQVPVLLCRDGAAEEVAPSGYRLPLGAQPDGAYEDAKAELRPGDVVVFSSDGLVEAPAQERVGVGEHLSPPAQPGELFGFERLARSAGHWSSAGESAEAVAEGIWQDVTTWCGEESHHDDMTLLVLRVPEPVRHG